MLEACKAMITFNVQRLVLAATWAPGREASHIVTVTTFPKKLDNRTMVCMNQGQEIEIYLGSGFAVEAGGDMCLVT